MTFKVEPARDSQGYLAIAMKLEDVFELLSAHEEGDTLQDSRAGNELLCALREAVKGWRYDANLDKVVPR